MGILIPEIALRFARAPAPPPVLPSKPWEQVVAEKLAQRDAAIPAAWRITPVKSTNVLNVAQYGILTPEELAITETATADLLAQLRDRRLTSEAVTTAFCKRAAIAQQLTNCLSEIFFEEGIAQARAIDAEYARTGTPLGELHGLPVSLKDQISLPGKDSAIGFVGMAQKPAAAEADIATTLRAAGAVFYCKTNVPTGMLMGETYNNIYGYTGNPYNTEMTSGGSSGGEGALLALRGSPLGVGSDIGGSIRVPCAVNGLWGLKSAGGRFSGLGCAGGLPGQESVKATTGPMGHDPESLELYTKVIMASKPHDRDPTCFDLPWRDVTLPNKLAFGIILDDGLCRPTPAVTRALLETKAALEAQGHTVVAWTVPQPERALEVAQRLFTADGGAALKGAIDAGGEPWPEGIKEYGEIYDALKDAPPTVSLLWKAQADRTAYLRDLLASIAASKDVTGTGRPFDGIISPVAPFPTCPRYGYRHILYTTLWNIADQSSVSFPAGLVSAAKDGKGDSVMDYRCNDEKEVWEEYDSQRLDGCPIGLQMVTRRHKDEEAIQLAKIAFDALAKCRAAQ